MATPLTKPVRREDLRHNYIITLAPEGLYLREKGRRKTYGPLSYERLYMGAVWASVEANRKERKPRGRGRRLRRA